MIDPRQYTDEQLRDAYAAALAELGIDEEQAHQVLDVETAELIEELSRIEVAYPLAAAALWVRDDAPWDQRRLAMSLVHPLSLVLGGNRSGKTYAILELAVAFALGGDHPATLAWVEDNRLPVDLVPLGPGEVYLVAESAGRSTVLHRTPINDLLPVGAEWYGYRSNDEAHVEIPVPGYERPAVIRFKTYRQRHGAYKGHTCRMVAMSEEPPDAEEGRLILAECLRGCAAVNGRVVMEMCPQDGFTWVWDDLYVARQYDCHVVELNTDHNTLVPDYASTQRWLNSLSPEEQAMRRLGRFVRREGLVYSAWSRGDGSRLGVGHTCDPFEIPPEWPRFCGADFGLADPTVVLWGAIGDDDTLYVYREHYAAGPTYQEHGEAVRAAQAGEVIEGAWGDPSASQVMEDWAAMDLYFDLANRAVAAGIDAVANRLRRLADGRPRLKVFDGPTGCPNLIREFDGYRRDPNKKDGAPIKKNDHALDALRYMVMGIAEWRGL